jgi:hypothetical protein
MKKEFVVLEPEEIVRLQGILMDHDGEEAWQFLITGNTKSGAIYSGKTADVKTLRIGDWVKEQILLF